LRSPISVFYITLHKLDLTVVLKLYLVPMHDFPQETLRERVERIESVKAGSLGGIAVGIVDGVTILKLY
jgi:hypothetical protein